MAGETQVAALSRVLALVPHRKTILEALDRVTSSASFQPSKRSQEFLRYIVEHALAGELDRIKERCIGSALFGRRPDYDTGSDSVVRVAANEVRKRLAAYYEQKQADDLATFHLPLGSYIPEIHLERIEPHAISPVAEFPLRAETPAPHPVPWRSLAIAGWCLAALLSLAWAGSVLRKSESAQGKSLRVLPWLALFEGGQTPRLILADSSMGALRVFYPFPDSIEDYANRRFLTPPAVLRPEFHGPWKAIAEKQHTSLADTRIAADYSPLAVAAGRVPVIRSARDFNLSDFRHGDNFILLGSSIANPWVKLFEDQMDFQLRYTPGRQTSVEIQHPRPGDPAHLSTGVVSGRTGEAYATLALVNGLSGRGRVLIAQGTNMEGTDLAGELALNPEQMAAELRACGLNPSNPAGRFEILLRLNTTAGSARASAILARRCRAGS